jgi:hypothetical protein
MRLPYRATLGAVLPAVPLRSSADRPTVVAGSGSSADALVDFGKRSRPGDIPLELAHPLEELNLGMPAITCATVLGRGQEAQPLPEGAGAAAEQPGVEFGWPRVPERHGTALDPAVARCRRRVVRDRVRVTTSYWSTPT